MDFINLCTINSIVKITDLQFSQEKEDLQQLTFCVTNCALHVVKIFF